ncbi:MAG: hypothetical protein GY772_27145 [bacterium]|nr:hypothetical protein [bacterium]
MSPRPGCLLCDDGCKWCEPVTPPEWFDAGTKTQRERVARGGHPLGGPLHRDEALRCQGCRHVVRRRRSSTYIKCGLREHTRGPGTDVRLKWRACSLYEAIDNTQETT